MGARRSVWLVAVGLAGAAVAGLVVWALPGVEFAARGLLAGVLVVAGVAKLRDRASFSDVLAGLGVGGAVVPALAVLLPLAEVVVAAGLLVSPTSTAGALGALVLLLVFSAVVLVQLARGPAADCGCFGSDHSAPLGAMTLLRNGVLIGFAAALAVTASDDPAAAFSRSPRVTSLAAVGFAAFVAIGMLARRKDASETVADPTLSVISGGEATESALTRRLWIRWAGGAGVAGVLGSWLDAVSAGAVTGTGPKTVLGECTSCSCCGPVTCKDDRGHCCGCCKSCCTPCSGFTGGGSVKTPSGSAQASFFGNKQQIEGNREKVIGGALSWFDSAWQGTGLLLQSTRIDSYRRVPGTQIRELVGLASANGQGKHKFVLRVVDSGKPGSGSDTVNLAVSGIAGGGAGGTGPRYTANGHLIQGDLTTQLQATVTVR
ncbi:MAG TPA: MauE/DoxX family redox-associated membrane protein [Solirubrobacteraceae bacterium]|nr:MauE/DoxX family redox-associated membrane protein [Solirubrobacteraceae bacterium]